jgi:hypothetical protein
MQTEEKLRCENCGYDLQGLQTTVECPECGVENRQHTRAEASKDSHSGGFLLKIINANVVVKGLAPVPDIRVRMKYWMKVGGLFVTAVFILQLLVTFAMIPIGLYRIALFGMSFLWPTVVIGMMPSKVDDSMPPMYRWIRRVVPATQWCWAIGYGLWFVFHVPQAEFTLGGNLKFFPPILMLHAIAGVGVAGVAFWLHDLALRLDLITVAKRCNVFTVATLTLGILVFVLPWKHFAAGEIAAEQGAIMWWAYILALMIPWLWMVSLFARALFEFSEDASWSLKYDDGLVDRQERVSSKRKEYQQKRGW